MSEEYSKNEIRTILRLFPYLNDKQKIKNLKIDEESKYYISIREHAEQISLIIKDNIVKLGLSLNDIIVTDATAGVGGNAISFGKHFKRVNAIELDEIRVDYLKNNIDVYDLKNVDIFEGDCVKLLPNLEQQVVFLDPPWGGRSYKKHKNDEKRGKNARFCSYPAIVHVAAGCTCAKAVHAAITHGAGAI